MNPGRYSNDFIGRKDILNILLCFLVTILIYYPLFYSDYLYTDESVQLWLYKKGSGFQMFIGQGRYITEKLFQWLFGKAHTVHDVRFIRLFSLFGWICCIPIWYFIVKKIVAREKLPGLLSFFSILFLVCTPPFAIYVSWASCLEQFIATTSGLVSGYLLYAAATDAKKTSWLILCLAFSALFGIISLFTYQNGFGCFLLPFVVHLIAKPKTYRVIFIGVSGCLALYAIYYFLFKFNLSINHIDAVDRTNISIDLFPKIRFFFGRALATSFHFTYLFNEKNIAGFFIYVITFFAWVAIDFYQNRLIPVSRRLIQFAFTLALLVLIYLPSLIVKENYASNRTLFSLNMAVFFLVAATLLKAFNTERSRSTLVVALSFLFMINARYNFRQQFLEPVMTEYKEVRAYLDVHYNPGIHSVYFIQPDENFFVKKYGITRSWDEFGVPSTFFGWVPEFFVKQVVFEKTGDRALAGKMTVRNGPKSSAGKPDTTLPKDVLILDTEAIMGH